MRVKMIVFGDENAPSYPKTEAVITNSFAALTNNDIDYPEIYGDVRSGMPAISEALKTSDILVLFASEPLYHEAKRTICRAFHFDMIHNEAVESKIRKFPNSDRYMMHALMPKNATAFPLQDGFYPGFALHSKRQCIMFLPLSDDRTFITMKKFVFPYIQRLYGTHLPNFSEYETAYAADVLERALILSKDINIAIANTPVCKYIAHAAKNIDTFTERVAFAPYDAKHSDKSTEELSAVMAADYYEYPIGVSAVEGGRDKDGNFTVNITVSNNKTAVIRTISSIPDESYDDFMNTVVTELFLMMAETLATIPENAAEEARHIKPSASIHVIKIIIYLLLFAITFFFTYVAASFSQSALFS